MARIAVYYDFHEEGVKPFTMVLKFKHGEMDWIKSTLYIPLKAPFKRHMAEEFTDGILNASVLLDDLTVNPVRPGCFGIHIPSIKQRYEQTLFDLYDIEQFIIQMSDIEEILQMEIRHRFVWK